MSVLAEQTFTNKNETREIVDAVMQDAFESVCSTMGPNGRYVVINQTNQPKVTKDGVSVAKALDFNEARKNLISAIITEPAILTDNEVGDGTTTTVFQTYHLYNKFKDAMTFKNLRYLDGLIRDVRDFLGKQIIECKVDSPEFRSMLMTSSNYEEEIVKKVLTIYQTYDKPNIRLVRVPSLKEDGVEETSDIVFDSKFADDQMNSTAGQKGLSVGAGIARLVFVDETVNTLTQESIDVMVSGSDRPVLLFARNFDQNALQVIKHYNANFTTRVPKLIAVTMGVSGRLGSAVVADQAALLGGTVCYNLRAIQDSDVCTNTADFIIHARGLFINGEQPSVKEAADKILEDLDVRYNELSVVERGTPIGNALFTRISCLRANNVTIKVTGVTESDTMERYYRYEDVMKAARTGLQYGVLPGIGYGYMEASKFILAQPKQSDEGLEQLRQDLAELLTYQYTHLTDIERDDEDFGKYIDLVTGDVSDKPTAVFDNAAATMIALEGAWATAKTLGKTNNIMGRSNRRY